MNFLLDTNVVSEMRKVRMGRADAGVSAWFQRQADLHLYISVICVHELERGVQLAERTDPAKGQLLRRWLEFGVLAGFEGRILDVDVEVAIRCAQLRLRQTCEPLDALIGATALRNRMTLVTRNAAHFEPLGVRVINPWLS